MALHRNDVLALVLAGVFLCWVALLIAAIALYLTDHCELSATASGIWLATGTVGIAIFLLLGRRQRAKEIAESLERTQQRKQHGLGKEEDWALVSSSNWRVEWNGPNPVDRVDWVEDEQRELLPGDTVFKWSRAGTAECKSGYAIEREGRIVAKVINMVLHYRPA